MPDATTEILICNVHPEHTATRGHENGWCPHCTAEIENAPDAATMTTEQKLSEWARWQGPLWVPFGKLHQRAEQLAGGPVWTHEFARPEGIADMIRDGGRVDHPLDTLERIAPGKSVVSVELDR